MARARPRLWIFVAATLCGCASKGKQAQDAAAPSAAGAHGLDDVDASAQELDGYEAQLRALGLSPQRDEVEDGAAAGGEGAEPADASPLKTEADRCERICALAEAICAIETNVCALAKDHPDDPRYANVCTRATGDCALASSACKECDGG